MSFDLGDYVDVAQRIQDFKEAFPEGSLRPANLEKPFTVETIGEKTFIVYAAAAYRNPNDPAPGVGLAWEPYPGKSNYTRDSELQNAETSAWGRAIIAVLASTSKKIASKQEVRNRRADEESAPAADDPTVLRAGIAAWGREHGRPIPALESAFTARFPDVTIATASAKVLGSFLQQLRDGEVLVGT